MAYDLTGAADFAKSEGKILLTDIVLKGQSFDILPIQEGIKSSDKLIDFADNGTVLQSGDYTDTDYSGGVTLTDKTISVVELHVKEKYTKNQLNSKIAQMAMKAGSSPEDLPFADVLVNLKGDAIASQNDKALWQGDVTKTTDATLKHFDGFIKQVKSATGDAKASYTGVASAALTSSNAITKVEAIIEKAFDSFPAWVEVPTMLAMSPKDFSTYYRAVNKLSGQVDKMTNSASVVKAFVVPGTNCTAYSIGGMNGLNDLIITRPENFVIGVDLKSEDEQFDFAYLQEALHHRFFALYKLGAKVARTQEVVISGVAPV